MNAKEKEITADPSRRCPYCDEVIRRSAQKCPHCHGTVDEGLRIAEEIMRQTDKPQRRGVSSSNTIQTSSPFLEQRLPSLPAVFPCKADHPAPLESNTPPDPLPPFDDVFPTPPATPLSDKHRSTYLILGICLGTFDAHNLYAGYTWTAVVQLLLGLTCFLGFISSIWAILEVCTVDRDATGKLFI